MEASRISSQTPWLARRLFPALRQHPLLGYYLLANGISWLILLVLGGLLALPVSLVIWFFTIGPTAAAVIVTAVVDGRAGLRRWLRRIGLWRVGLRWYLVALLGLPLVLLLGTLVMPGVLASFRPMSPARVLVTYVIVFALAGIPGGRCSRNRAGGASPCRVCRRGSVP